MTPDEFAAWVEKMRDERGMSARRLSIELGCGRNQIAVWAETGAPRYIGLACSAVALGFPPWTNPKQPEPALKPKRRETKTKRRGKL
jgi:hypothetical protein